MPMSADQLADHEEELRAVLLARGCAPADADEIIDTAIRAAQQGIASMVAVAGDAQSHNRDSVIILALNIMERLALSADRKVDPGKQPAKSGGGGRVK